MNELSDALKRFNRKERNLLIRAVLGDTLQPLCLSEKFVGEVGRELKIELQEKEKLWWATDYHISWLAGALAYHTEGKACLSGARPNRSNDPSKSMSRLIEGNQEDIDLIIASGQDLILVEAKAFGAWDNPQLQSKLDRLSLIREEYEHIAERAKVTNRMQMHFLLLSPNKPTKIAVHWPKWTRKEGPSEERIPWICLELPKGEPILEVNRCDGSGTKSGKGTYWRIVEHRARRSNPKEV